MNRRFCLNALLYSSLATLVFSTSFNTFAQSSDGSVTIEDEGVVIGDSFEQPGSVTTLDNLPSLSQPSSQLGSKPFVSQRVDESVKPVAYQQPANRQTTSRPTKRNFRSNIGNARSGGIRTRTSKRSANKGLLSILPFGRDKNKTATTRRTTGKQLIGPNTRQASKKQSLSNPLAQRTANRSPMQPPTPNLPYQWSNGVQLTSGNTQQATVQETPNNYPLPSTSTRSQATTATANQPMTAPRQATVALAPVARTEIATEAVIDPKLVELLAEANALSQKAKTELQYTQVIRMCRRALAADLDGATSGYAKQLGSWALNRRGQFFADANKTDQAMIDFNEAIRLNSKCWRAVHGRGVLYAQAGKFSEAFDMFNQTIEINPQFAKAYSNRAGLLVQANDLVGALKDYRRSIKLDPNLAIAHAGRGRVCHMLGSLDEARQHFDAAVQLATGNAHHVVSRADLLTDMGLYQAACVDYARAIELNPALAQAYRGAAWLKATCPNEQFRDSKLALDLVSKSIELSSSKSVIDLDTLAAAQANAGDFDAAIETMKQAVELAADADRSVYESRQKMYEQQTAFRTQPVSSVEQASFEVK